MVQSSTRSFHFVNILCIGWLIRFDFLHWQGTEAEDRIVWNILLIMHALWLVEMHYV